MATVMSTTPELPHGASTIELTHGEARDSERHALRRTMIEVDRGLTNSAQALGKLAGDHRIVPPDELTTALAEVRRQYREWTKHTLHPLLHS